MRLDSASGRTPKRSGREAERLAQLARDQFFDHLTAGLGQLLEAAAVEVRQLVVIQAEQMQQGDVQILDRMHHLHRGVADLIGRADHMASLHSASGEEHRLRVGIVVAADRDATSSMMIVGAPAELPEPHHKGLVEQAPLLEILDQRSDGLVNAVDARFVRAFQVIVRIPTAGEDLHEAHAFLDQSSR